LGKVQISNDNPLLQITDGHRISPLLGEKLVYIGQLDSYERGSEIAERLLNLQISDSQIYRITDGIGERTESWLAEEDLRKDFTTSTESEEVDKVIYAQVDGSMLLTREESWKEVKLGRIFSSRALYAENERRNWLKQSEYVAHFGHHLEFEDKMSALLDGYAKLNEQLVFINDGARWQWNWIDAEYPKATQILDFYHAMEHIGKFVSLIKSGVDKKLYLTQLSDCLKEKGVLACWEKIEELECRTQTQIKEKKSLKKYIDSNRKRMDYPEYLKRKLLIGSGAIESAHRTVIQRRMKLSGQRWSKKGAKNMLHLRTLNMSGHWERVINFFKNAA